MTDPVQQFLSQVETEVSFARQKFPDSDACMVALTEEVGELAKALLSESLANVYKEAVQVAAMAARVAIDGDPSLARYRHYHGPKP